ncbi:dihydrofolate reductase family protein [Microbacterium kribbense]|uniref:Dihydrofolate reductase family protein n=1 Tax=Microbacterium kribbense TaxID=433645 RepID=A0ABP7G9Y2_9MICO
MTTIFYTASSLDGFIATSQHGLDWLLRRDVDPDGPMGYAAFARSVGALVMGAATYEWLLAHDAGWAYAQPTWVLTHRPLPARPGADVRVAHGDVRAVHEQMTAAAGDRDLWVVGGGDVARQFAVAGLLDEIWVQFAPVTLGAGIPFLPLALELALLQTARNREFLCGRYRVVGVPGTPDPVGAEDT